MIVAASAWSSLHFPGLRRSELGRVVKWELVSPVRIPSDQPRCTSTWALIEYTCLMIASRRSLCNPHLAYNQRSVVATRAIMVMKRLFDATRAMMWWWLYSPWWWWWKSAGDCLVLMHQGLSMRPSCLELNAQLSCNLPEPQSSLVLVGQSEWRADLRNDG